MASVVDDMSGKTLEMALEIIKDASRAGFLMNPASTMAAFEQRDLKVAAKQRGITLYTAEAKTPGEIEGAVGALAKTDASFIVIQPNTVFSGANDQIAKLAIRAQLPTVTTAQSANMVQAGIMLSYGVDQSSDYRRVASFVDRILKGAKPSELPIEFPTRLVLSVNLKTAKALGVTIPQSVLLRADEVIE